MEILTEFDGLLDALSKVNLNESVMPYVNGVLVDDVAYNKVQKLLQCPEMVSAHKYLLDCDLEHLDEEDSTKIDRLYNLAVQRGFVQNDLTDWDKELDIQDINNIVNDQTITTQTSAPAPAADAGQDACWAVIYSATAADGSLKTGEAYSDAESLNAAKADAKAKLANIGYSNISILAIEKCAENKPACGCCCDTTAYVVVNEEDDKDGKDEEQKNDDDADSSVVDVEDEVIDITSDDIDDDDEGDRFEPPAEDDEADDAEEKAEDDEEDGSEEDNSEEKKELTDAEKKELKDEYISQFRKLIGKYEVSFNELPLEDKIEFLTKLSKSRDGKPEDFEFMTTEEIEQLNNVVVKDEDADESRGEEDDDEFKPPAEDDDSEEKSEEAEEGEDEDDKFEPPADDEDEEKSDEKKDDEDK
jgi:hypothetical protein